MVAKHAKELELLKTHTAAYKAAEQTQTRQLAAQLYDNRTIIAPSTGCHRRPCPSHNRPFAAGSFSQSFWRIPRSIHSRNRRACCSPHSGLLSGSCHSPSASLLCRLRFSLYSRCLSLETRWAPDGLPGRYTSVSYTHLDVYKRQVICIGNFYRKTATSFHGNTSGCCSIVP